MTADLKEQLNELSPDCSPSRGSMIARKFADSKYANSAGIKENPAAILDELWLGKWKGLETLKKKGPHPLYDRLEGIYKQIAELEPQEKEFWGIYKLPGTLDPVKLRQHCEQSLRSDNSPDSKQKLKILEQLHSLRKDKIDILTELTERYGPRLNTRGTGYSQEDKALNHETTRSNLWAVLIGINEYQKIKPLRGAVRDTEMLKHYLVSDLAVPADHIRVLNDTDATRSAILSALYDLRDNTEIQRGDAIIIHFSGHGASYDVREIFKNGVGSIEAICPVDRGVEDAEHATIVDISDREMNLFLAELSSKKGDNITLILDCCYAGGAARAESVFQARDTLPLPDSLQKMLLAAENNPRKEWPSGSALSEDWTPDLSSHVVLAACQDFERAWECGDAQGGDFTIALVDALRTLPPPYTSTYDDIIKRIGRLRRQDPCALGNRVDSLIFAHGSDMQLPTGPVGIEKQPEPQEAQLLGYAGIMDSIRHVLGLGMGW